MLLALPTLLGGCGPTDPQGVDTAPAFTVHLEPVVAYNQAPFAGIDELEIVLDPDGAATSWSFPAPGSGDTVETPQLPGFEGLPVEVRGLADGAVVAWGRSPPLTATPESPAASADVFFASVDAPAWLGGLSPGLYRPMVLPLGGGEFLIAGGSTEITSGSTTDLSFGQDTVARLSLVPPASTLAPVDETSLSIYVGAEDRESHTERVGATMARLTSGPDAGKILMVGGSTGPGWLAPAAITGDATLYDLDAGTWAPLGAGASLDHPRAEHLAVPTGSGGLVVGGGWVNDGDGLAAGGSIEIYDPEARSFGGAIDVAGLGTLDLVGATLPDRGALLCGGAVVEAVDGTTIDSFTGSKTCALVGDDLAPATDDVPSLPANLVGAAMIALPDGRTLLAGGAIVDDVFPLDQPVTAISNAWILPAGGMAWSRLSPMNVTRAGHTMALLPDGRVLIAGGAAQWSATGVPDAPYACLEIFDPAETTFTSLGDCAADSGDLAMRAWKPVAAVDDTYGALFVGGATPGRDGPVASTQLTLFLPSRSR